MNNKRVSVLPWNEALKMLPRDNPNVEFCKLISEICEELKLSNKNYVYYTSFEFGEKLIDKGSVSLDQFSVVHDSYFKKTGKDMVEDLSYSQDPLGLVIKNHIEIYSENIIINKSGQAIDSYLVPLNIINEGDLFGLFGVLDFLTENKSNDIPKTSSPIAYDWYAIAGNICFELAWPFENDTDFSFISDQKWAEKFRIKYDKLNYVGENKISFVREFIYAADKNHNTKNRWTVDVIYFPRHFFEIKDIKLKRALENYLFKAGWLQSSPLRYALFENKIIAEALYQSAVTPNHDKHFLNVLYDYIIKSGKGKQYTLKPLLSSEHILNIALQSFKSTLGNYLKKAKHYEPLILIYDKIIDEKDWGIISADNLPFLLNYHFRCLNMLYFDLHKMRDDISSQKTSFPALPEIIMTKDDGSGKERIKGRNTVRAYLSNAININEEHICLSSKYFKNLILIKGLQSYVS